MSESKTNQVFLYLPLSVLEQKRTLNNGNKFPMISFGVSQIEGFDNIYNAVDVALETGYRSFDCTPILNQEENLGKALIELLPKYELQRNDIIITSKILSKDYGSDSTSEAFWHSCEKLKTNYLDAYLMQWPGGDNLEPNDEQNFYLREETWKEMIQLNRRGAVKNIGVCNFSVNHIKHIQEFSDKLPAINQVEFHPKFPQLELLDFCKGNNILVQGISFKNTFHSLLINDTTVKKVAKSVGKTATQVLLKWAINKGVAVIPQSQNPKKIRQNFDLFDNFVLEKPDMDAIDSITIREKYLRNPICVT